jgi:hypothetical protein
MHNQSEFLDASGNLNHEAVRAHFLRTGKLDGLVKGDTVYIDFFGRWERVRLIRMLPGGVWLAKCLFDAGFFTKTTVSVVNFGGKCA